MALEDAVVLAEALRSAETVEVALDRYAARRRPRATWVQEQSRIAAKAWVLPPAIRDAALRERGDQLLRDRYRPLIAAAVATPPRRHADRARLTWRCGQLPSWERHGPPGWGTLAP